MTLAAQTDDFGLNYQTTLDRIRGVSARPFELDPIRTAQVVYEGGRLYEQENAEPATLRAIIWRLLQEAASCDRSIRKPGPRDKSRSGPEVFYTASEIFAVELQWVAENISYPPRIVETPTADAFARYHDVMTWLRFVRCRNNKPLRVRMLLALAAGLPPSRAVDAFRALNFPNADAVWAAKNRAINNIAEKIQVACKDMTLRD